MTQSCLLGQGGEKTESTWQDCVSSVILLLTTQFFYDKQANIQKHKQITLFICTHTHKKKSPSTVTTMKSSNKLTCLYYISTITKLHKKANQFRFVDSVCVCAPWVSSFLFCVWMCVPWASRYNLNGAQKVCDLGYTLWLVFRRLYI